MGRIKTDGMILVDIEEAMELLGKSRTTIFRMIQTSKLTKIPVSGYHNMFVTLDSIERYKGPQFTLKLLDSDRVQVSRKVELEKRFPDLFKHRSVQYDRPHPHPPHGQFPSSEE